MVKTLSEVRMANEDENGLRYGFLKRRPAVSFSKVQVIGSKIVEILQK